MLQRPKFGETDEDILRLQRAFQESNTQPGVTLIRDSTNPNHEDEASAVIEEQIGNTFEMIPNNRNIGGIVERQNDKPVDLKFKMSKTGFPKAKRRDVTISGKKGSIFAQQMKRQKKDDSLTYSTKEANEPSFPKQSCIVSGKEKDVIHQENINLLRRMKEEDILKERKQLLESMDPAIIAFLKDRRRNYKEVDAGKPSIAEQNNVMDTTIEEIVTPHSILSEPNSEKWLNFDTVEMTKLAWMKDVTVNKKLKINSQFEARFDFDGFLLPYMGTEINEKNRALFHHGEEPERPGYTLQELFQLCRSSVLQQKIVALTTIANILSLESSGVYEEVIELPIEQIFFVLRFCVDDNTPSVLNASLKALRNLFYNHIDEVCINNLQGFGLGVVQPILAVNAKDIEDDETINDQQVAEADLVKCLSRTHILTRIRYVINTVKPSSTEIIVNCLEILIRLARDSDFVWKQLWDCKDLIGVVVKNFLSPYFGSQLHSRLSYGYPLTIAVKLVKVLCSRSKSIAVAMINRYKVMDSIVTYISNDFVSLNADGLKLQIESMHLWSTLLNYDLSKEYFAVLEPVLVRLLYYHTCNTNVDASLTIQTHASALLNLLSYAPNVNPYLDVIINVAVPKWITQFCAVQQLNCGKLQIISALLSLLGSLFGKVELIRSNGFVAVNAKLKFLLDSKAFTELTNSIKNGSNLLTGFVTYKSSPNLIRVEAATWNSAEHIVPILQTHSCMLFLCALSKCVLACTEPSVKVAFIKHANVRLYLNQISECTSYGMTTNWFTRIETLLLMNALKIAIQVAGTTNLSNVYDLAVKCMSVFNSEQKSDVELILQSIVFNPEMYPAETLFKRLTIDDRDNHASILQNLPNICNLYIDVLNLRNDLHNFDEVLSVDVRIGNIIPVDWIYSPILVMYSEQQQRNDKETKQEDDDRQINIIRNCLRWIYIYETYFPELIAAINPTDRFCRLACIFLASDSSFLDADIQRWLTLCLSQLLKYESEIDFDRDIQGLNSFQDLYIQLLEQYQGVSYGNQLFGNFILTPLTQRHNAKWKKILFSEYAGVVQIFNVTKEQILLEFDKFVQPAEKDESLIKCYGQIIRTMSIRKQSVLYDILICHLRNYHVK